MPSSPISPCPSCPANAARGHGCAVYSSSATDAQWAILEPLLPAPGSTAGRGGRPEKHCRRAIVDAILYIVVVCGNCRWSSHQPGRCPRCSPAGPAAGRGSVSSTRCATDCGCGRAGPVPDRGDHRLPDGTSRRHRAPIQPRLGWRQENERRQAAHRRGCERPAAHRRRHRRLDPRPRRRTPTRVDQQAPPLRARPRNHSRPPRSHGPPRHDHDHDQTTRPNLTVFKHPLRDAQTDPCLVSRETGVIRSCLNRRSRTSPSAATQGNKHCVQNSAPPGPLGGLPEGHVESIDGSDQQAKGIMCDVR